MEHPLITDLDSLTLDQLQDRINDLSKKLSWAQKSKNNNLCFQIQMAIESYRNKYQQKQQEIWDAAKKTGNDYADKIDIS